MIQQWSSSEIVARERLGFWVDVVCRTLVKLRCEPTSDQKFFGEIDFDELGPLKLVSVRSVAQRVSRTGEALGSRNRLLSRQHNAGGPRAHGPGWARGRACAGRLCVL